MTHSLAMDDFVSGTIIETLKHIIITHYSLLISNYLSKPN